MFGGVLNFDSSWFQITLWIPVAPRPPNSTGQVMQAQPASAFLACHSWARLMISSLSASFSASPLAPSLGSRSSALAVSQARAWARNAASSGVSLKSMVRVSPGSGRALGVEALDQHVSPLARAAEREAQQLRAPVEHVAVEFPREADAAVQLDHLLAHLVEGVGRAD